MEPTFGNDGTDLRRLAAAAAHELRTPLTAIAGEVELALRRERSPARYREALGRIGIQVAELIALTQDLELLTAPDSGISWDRPVRLAAVFESVRKSVDPKALFAVTPDVDPELTVRGDEASLARAFVLLLRQAAAQLPETASVALRVMPAQPDAAGDVEIVIDAGPHALPADTWKGLEERAGETQPVSGDALLRLRTAADIVHRCGGSIEVPDPAGPAPLRLRLPREARSE